MKMVIYVVILYIDYEGCSFDNNTKYFFDEKKADEYAEELNKTYGYDGIDGYEVNIVEEG